MSDFPRCLRCGHQGRDVSMSLIEVPAEEQRDVVVRVPVVHREGAVEMPLTVPERYAPEPRCRDIKACTERAHAIEDEVKAKAFAGNHAIEVVGVDRGTGDVVVRDQTAHRDEPELDDDAALALL